MQLGERHEVRQPRHGAVIVNDLTDHAGRVVAAETGDIDCRLRMAGAHQHPALARLQLEHMTWRRDVNTAPDRVDGDRYGPHPFGSGNAGGHAFVRIDGDGKRLGLALLLLAGHQRQAKLLYARRGQRHTSQAAPVFRHEVDRVRRRHLCRDDVVALVFVTLVVHENKHAPVAGFLDDLLDGGAASQIVRRERRGRPQEPVEVTCHGSN